MDTYTHVSTGVPGLDSIMDGLRLGDNVVWQVDSIEDFRRMVDPYVEQAFRDERKIIYIRFGDHAPLLSEDDMGRVTVHTLKPSWGFERFATAVHRILADEGHLAFYVFDCLTDLLVTWHSDLMVMNFFKVTCPFLYELDTIAYFALIRNEHTFQTIAGIRETTQLLLDLYRIDDETYVHPLKVWARHSPTMFFPHLITGDEAISVTSSEASARLFSALNRKVDPPDHWSVLIDRARQALFGTPEEQEAAKELLISVIIGRENGDENRMIELCRRYMTLADVLAIATREIGTGYVGGKSVGMLAARAILEHDPQGRFAGRLEPHDSFFLGSDLFYTYIVANGWWRLMAEQKTPDGYFRAGAELRTNLAQGRFPPAVREQFLQMLEYFGQSPIIVRSSSLLEDNFGNAFAGKYESVFCTNQGNPEERHRAFEDAVRTVYASAMSEEALTYRLNRGLVDRDEQMAILVQRVSGDHHGDAFYPHAAGVGNSSNLYVWDPDVDMDAGMIRLVFGLGTRAVDRTYQDYARIVTLDDPTRARLLDAEDLSRFSQRYVDVLSLADNTHFTIPLDELTDTDIKTDWRLFLSPDQAALRRYRELRRTPKTPPTVLDFRKLLAETDFGALMRDILHTLSTAYDYPVDVEFTVNFRPDGQFKVSIVQCRPLQTRGLGKAVEAPRLEDERDCFFATDGNFMGGNARLSLEYVVTVRPEAYLPLGQQDKHAVARGIGALNTILKGTPYLLMGPGRWGTSTPSLGVPVRFVEICNATVLAEVTYQAGGFRPELSYGSHFFQDLVESGIFYVAVFDGDRGVVYNRDWALGRENLLTELDPSASALTDVIHVARFDELVLYADIVSQRLVCR